MTSLGSSKHQYNKVALAAIVFLLTTMIDVREQTMLPDHSITTVDLLDPMQVTQNSRVQSATMPSTESPASHAASSGAAFSPTLPVTSIQQPVPSFPSASLVAEESLVHSVASITSSTVAFGTTHDSVTTLDMLASGTQSSQISETDSPG
uniref:Uncharacterized protein n=1 Tax=Anopheles atroparvus TaxID=41427 RepID=A0AAG5CZP7_ANOAO